MSFSGMSFFSIFLFFAPRMYVILPFWEEINGAFRSIFCSGDDSGDSCFLRQ